MKIVFVHRQGPGQFTHLACHLANTGWQVSFLCQDMNVRLPGVRILRQRITPPPPQTALPDYHLQIGLQAASTLQTLIDHDGPPDIVFGHIGWGSMMFARDILPDTPLIGYCEHYYQADGRDAGFAPDDIITPVRRMQLRLRNLAQLATLDTLDAAISPTPWQKSAYPAPFQPRIGICHDGIDTDKCRPDPHAVLRLPGGQELRKGDPIISFVARDLEPYRGFPQFMRAAAQLARQRPDARFVVVGGDGISYGQPRPDGQSWRDVMLAETGITPQQIIFAGQIPHAQLITLFQITAAHVYLTYPFVLSWSMLEAMACGAPIIASDTGPCRDVIGDGQNGILCPFDDPQNLASQMARALDEPEIFAHLGRAARQTVTGQFSLRDCLQRQTAMLERLIAQRGKTATMGAHHLRAYPARGHSHG